MKVNYTGGGGTPSSFYFNMKALSQHASDIQNDHTVILIIGFVSFDTSYSSSGIIRGFNKTGNNLFTTTNVGKIMKFCNFGEYHSCKPTIACMSIVD